jgi:class 3 adenylate cyclase/TolB-like protein/Flp pilus assembly protein TadD
VSANTEQRKLAAIMFTDMVGYSALAQRNDKLALELLEEHRRLLREIFPRFNGIEIKTIGDAFLIEFNSALEAARCAIEIQRTLAKRNHDVSAERRIEVRIGIHIGDVVHRGGDVYGDGVNIASRIEQLAAAGGICVSMDVERQIRNALEARFEKLAPTELKNISVSMDLFRIVLPWEQPSISRREEPKSEIGNRAKSSAFAKWIGATVLILLVAGVAGWLIRARNATPSSRLTTGRISSLAVLPFKNYSGEANQEYFSDGMTDLLTTELGGIGALTVKSHQSALKFKNSTKSMPEIGRELNADAIIEGSVLRESNHVTVNVQLIEALTDRHLWAKKFEGDLTNIFKMRNEVVEAIAREIKTTISPDQGSRLNSARTVNPAAFEEYLLGRQAWSRQTERGWDDALGHFNRATKIDPGFAPAWAGLSDAYWSAADAQLSPVESRVKAKAAAERAVELDDSLGEAHTALAMDLALEFQWAKSEHEFQRAIQLKPNDAIAHWQCGWLFVCLGRADEALKEMQHAVELDPLSAVMTTDVNVAYQMKAWRSSGAEAEANYDKAIAQCQKALALDPSFFLPHFSLGLIEMHRLNYPKAIEEMSLAAKIESQPVWAAHLGYVYAQNGERDKALKVLEDLDQLAGRRFVSPYCQALVYLGLGENRQAINWLEKAYEQGSPWLGWLKVETMFDPLRSDPRFQALYKKVNFPP